MIDQLADAYGDRAKVLQLDLYRFSETGLQIFLSAPLKERGLSEVEADLYV